jgi:hypothetical protein
MNTDSGGKSYKHNTLSEHGGILSNITNFVNVLRDAGEYYYVDVYRGILLA